MYTKITVEELKTVFFLSRSRASTGRCMRHELRALRQWGFRSLALLLQRCNDYGRYTDMQVHTIAWKIALLPYPVQRLTNSSCSLNNRLNAATCNSLNFVICNFLAAYSILLSRQFSLKIVGFAIIIAYWPNTHSCGARHVTSRLYAYSYPNLHTGTGIAQNDYNGRYTHLPHLVDEYRSNIRFTWKLNNNKYSKRKRPSLRSGL